MKAVMALLSAAWPAISAAAEPACGTAGSRDVCLPYGDGTVQRVRFCRSDPDRPHHRVFAYEWHPDPYAVAVNHGPTLVKAQRVSDCGKATTYYYERPAQTTFAENCIHVSKSGKWNHSYSADIGLLEGSGDEGLRNTAAAWLGKYGDPAALPYLRRAAGSDPSPTVRDTASASAQRIERRYAGRYVEKQ